MEHIRKLEVKSWIPDNAHRFPHSAARGEFVNTIFASVYQ